MKDFKEIKHLQVKSETYLEPKRTSMMEPFVEIVSN